MKTLTSVIKKYSRGCAYILKDGIILNCTKSDFKQNKEYEFDFKLPADIRLTSGLDRVLLRAKNHTNQL